MTDNILQTLQQLVQDVIAPDVRELKVRVASIERQIEGLGRRVDAIDSKIERQIEALDHKTTRQAEGLEKQSETRFEALQHQMEAQYKSILAAIAESKAQTDLVYVRELARLSERVAVLEAQRH